MEGELIRQGLRPERREGSSLNPRHTAWRAIVSGIRRESEGQIRMMTDSNLEVERGALPAIEQVCSKPSLGAKRVRLTLKTLSALGFKGRATFDAVVCEASRQELDLCPQDSAFFIRPRDVPHHSGRHLRFVSEPIHFGDRAYNFVIKQVERETVLGATKSFVDDFIELDEVLVFVIREPVLRAD